MDSVVYFWKDLVTDSFFLVMFFISHHICIKKNSVISFLLLLVSLIFFFALVTHITNILIPYYVLAIQILASLFLLFIGWIDVARSMEKKRTILFFSKDFVWSKFHPDYKSKVSFVKK